MNPPHTIITTNLQRSPLPAFWLFFCLVIFTACLGGGGGTPAITGDTVLLEPGSQGTVVCNAVCAQWGQCGDKTDGTGQVVLAGRGGPAIVNHELIFPHSTPVTIQGQEVRSLQPVTLSDPFNMNFYYAVTTDGSKGGWVAGWCVQAVTN